MKICQINQPAGIGDIFFTQKIAAHYVDRYYKVIWPVRKDFLWLNDYLISPGVLYTNPDAQIMVNDSVVQPDVVLELQTADQVYPDKKLMECKYELAGLDYTDWTYYFNFKRNTDKENSLFYDILNLTDTEEYAFVSKFVGTPPEGTNLAGDIKKDINVNTKLRVVELDYVVGYNVLDWCKVLENASEIYMVDTVFNYILEKLNLKATTKHLYSRYTPADFSHIEKLWKVNWKYIKT